MAPVGSIIEFPQGSAYRSLPVAGRGPAVVVLHEGFGLDDCTRERCDRLARAGLGALAPDLCDGEVTRDPARATRVESALDLVTVLERVDAAVSALLDHDATDGGRVGAVGSGVGGALALLASAHNERIGAVVSFGGLPDDPVPPWLTSDAARAPALLAFGERDPLLEAEGLVALERAFRVAGRALHLRRQEGAGPHFSSEARPDCFDARATVEAWAAAIGFLRAEL